jgi:hypothetical protein
MALCPIYSPLVTKPSVPSMALCPLYGPVSLYGPLSPFTNLCYPLRSSSPLQLSSKSTALCHLYSSLPPLQRSVPSTGLCPLYSLCLLSRIFLSTALCPLYTVEKAQCNYVMPMNFSHLYKVE